MAKDRDTNYDLKIAINGRAFVLVYRARISRNGILYLTTDVCQDILNISPRDILEVIIMENKTLYEIKKL